VSDNLLDLGKNVHEWCLGEVNLKRKTCKNKNDIMRGREARFLWWTESHCYLPEKKRKNHANTPPLDGLC